MSRPKKDTFVNVIDTLYLEYQRNADQILWFLQDWGRGFEVDPNLIPSKRTIYRRIAELRKQNEEKEHG